MKENKKKIYLVSFTYKCHLCECGQIIDDEISYDDIGYRLDFEQDEGRVSKDTTKILFTGDIIDLTITDKETGKQIKEYTDDDGDVCPLDWFDFGENATGESWIEKKLKLKEGNRYYIQGYQIRYGGTFNKKVTFKIETEGVFDLNKLSIIYDTKFDDLYWKIYNDKAEGNICGDVEPDEGVYNPYEIYYDGKKYKVNKFRVDRVLRGESYMCFKW